MWFDGSIGGTAYSKERSCEEDTNIAVRQATIAKIRAFEQRTTYNHCLAAKSEQVVQKGVDP